MDSRAWRTDQFRWTDIEAAIEIERTSFTVGVWHAETFWRQLALPSSVFLAARDGDQLAGYAVVEVTGEDAHLHSIAVATRLRRRGVAAALFADLLATEDVGRARRILLEVSEDNVAASAFYRARGFAPLGVRRDYYRAGEHAVIMELIPDPGGADG